MEVESDSKMPCLAILAKHGLDGSVFHSAYRKSTWTSQFYIIFKFLSMMFKQGLIISRKSYDTKNLKEEVIFLAGVLISNDYIERFIKKTVN